MELGLFPVSPSSLSSSPSFISSSISGCWMINGGRRSRAPPVLRRSLHGGGGREKPLWHMLGCPDVTRRACMRRRKCPSQLAWTLNWLYPASSQVQSLFNVRLSPCLNRAAHCHDTHTHSRVYYTIIQIILIAFAESCAVHYATNSSSVMRRWASIVRCGPLNPRILH